ncbi:unnamed protein product, partial [marine sediment metagenome]
ISKVAKHYNCDWSVVKSRIVEYQNPELTGETK